MSNNIENSFASYVHITPLLYSFTSPRPKIPFANCTTLPSNYDKVIALSKLETIIINFFPSVNLRELDHDPIKGMHLRRNWINGNQICIIHKW